MRIAIALIGALAYALLSYFLIQSKMWDIGLISITFALLQPAVICAFVAFLGDPLARRPRSYYLLVPPALTLGMIAVSVIFLQEGVVCILMLAPLWLLGGFAGTLILHKLRPTSRTSQSDAQVFQASALLVIPLLFVPLEQSLPLPEARYQVERSVVIEADREKVWALMQSVPQIEEGEGNWNFTQSLVGVPRPLQASLIGTGTGAIRQAHWGAGIYFEEHVTQWQEGRLIAWDFVFPPSNSWDFTDPHLHPDSEYMTIETGGYSLVQLGEGRFELTLYTTYSARTRMNPYAALWGEVFLGDIQSNILAVIKARVGSSN